MNTPAFVRFLLCFALLASIPAHAQAPATQSLAAFGEQLRAAGTHSRFDAALLGIKVESLDSGKLIYEQNADKLLKPASNAKIYSGALALDRLGPDYRVRTSFYAGSRPDRNGTLKGDLIVYGRGDPSLSHRFNDGDYIKPFEQLADALVRAGVKRITGNLIGDESHFRGSRFGTGWSVDDLQYYYGAEVSALTFQENTVDLIFTPGAKPGDPVVITTKPQTGYLTFINRARTGEKDSRASISVHRPVDSNVVLVEGSIPVGGSKVEDAVAVYDAPRWFVWMLRDALAKRGVKVQGELKTRNWLDRELEPLDTAKLTEVAFMESRPMAEMVKHMMKPSQNLYAHLLLMMVGERTRSPENKRSDSESLGLAEMGRFLAEAGVPKGDVLLEEGSGLSRGCLLKPSATVQLLKYMHAHRHAQSFIDSLPVAGVDGTLRSRFKGTAAEKNLTAKTGTIRYVNSLSGYVTTKAGEKLVFSIMLNNYNGGDGRTQSDAIAATLATLGERTN